MVAPPTADVRAELISFLEQDKTRLGEVYRLNKRGLNALQIAEELGVASSGFVGNYRASAEAILDGVIMKSGSMAEQTAARVRTLLKSQDFSEGTRAYLHALHDDLVSTAGIAPKPMKPGILSAAPSGAGNLRAAVDGMLRERAEQLIDRIKKQTQLDADDYYRVISAQRPLDQLVDLIDRQTPSATSLALFQQKRHELTIEQAVINWSVELPLTSALVESARGRVQYWMHE